MLAFKRYEDRETLERLKRWPGLFKRFQKVRIFSAEWGYFWRGNGIGYTSNPEESDVKTIEDAFKQTRHCGPEKRIQFIKA